jgi:alkylation response protein AidB-like acyl-CoA dehydrogenase
VPAVLRHGFVITGSKKFVYGMQGVDACVVLARVAERWGCFIVPSGSEGLKKIDIGQRTGLRACDVNHIELAGVKVPESSRIDDGDALPMVMKALSLNWLGMSAIAVGAARRAVSEAKKYSSERYQGGAMIETHPAVKMLIASSEAKALAAESTVNSFADFGSDPVKCLRQAAMTKLSVLELTNKAVTDSLQVFGGYGYMDDFGMSKRLRDVITLKSASGSPAFLKQFIFDLEKIDM